MRDYMSDFQGTIYCGLSPTILSKPSRHHSERVQQAHQSTQDNREEIRKYKKAVKEIHTTAIKETECVPALKRPVHFPGRQDC